MHKLIAEKLRREPGQFEKVRSTLERWSRTVCVNSQGYVSAWQAVIDEGIEAALSLATEDSEHARAMRQSTPFVGILTNQERFAFLKQWKAMHGTP